jgi:NIMA (never in mitosis gene a)-related kinase
MNNMKVQSENEVYERLKLLGEGAFGKAYLVREKSTELLCVIKQMNIAEMSATEQ